MQPDSNAQSQPKRVYADPIDIQKLCLRSDYWGADCQQLVTGDRVQHPDYGDGIVRSYSGESTVLKYVMVEFDSGKSLRVHPETLTHI